MSFFLSALESGEQHQSQSGAQQREAVSDCVFEVSFLAVVVELMRVLPVRLVSTGVTGAASDASRLVELGPRTKDLMCRMLVGHSLTAVLPAYSEVFVALLRHHDLAALGAIQSAQSLVGSAKLFCAQSLAAVSATMDNSELLERLVDRLREAMPLLDCATAETLGDAVLRSEKLALAESLPLLLVAANQYEDKEARRRGDSDALVDSVYCCMLRVLCCGGDEVRLKMLTQLLLWIRQSHNMVAAAEGGVLFADKEAVRLSPLVAGLINRLDLVPTADRGVMATLCSPAFVRSLLLTCTLQAQKGGVECDSDPKHPELRDVSLQLLELLCGFVTAQGEVPESILSEWAGQLGLLKLLEWEGDCGAFSAPLPGQGPVAAAMSSSSPLTSTMRFTDMLQRFCHSSSVAEHRVLYFKALTMGVFHHSAVVRTLCATRIQSELFGARDVVGAATTLDRLQNRHDPFNSLSPLKLLQSWDAKEAIALLSALPVSKVARSHSDLLKLHQIAFGSSAAALDSDNEVANQKRALQQMSEFLADDAMLLSTVTAEWVVTLAQQLICTLEALTAAMEDSNYHAVSNASQAALSAKLASSHYFMPSSHHCELMVISARLLSFLLTHCASLAKSVCCEPSAAHPQGFVNLHIPLRCFLIAGTAKRGSNRTLTELYDTAVKVGTYCGQALEALCVAVDSWDLLASADCTSFDLSEQFTSRFVATERSVDGNGDNNGSAAVASMRASDRGTHHRIAAVAASTSCRIVPTFLTAHIHRMECVTSVLSCSTALMYTPGRLVIGSTNHQTLPAADLLTAVVDEYTIVSPEDIQVVAASVLFEHLSEAKSHSALRSALAACTCLTTVQPHITRVFLSVGLDLFVAVSNIMTNQPKQSPKDYITFSRTAQFLTSVLHQLHSCEQQQTCTEKTAAFVRDLTQGILHPIEQYFRDNVTTTYVRRFQTREEQRAFDEANYSVQLHSLRLLHAICRFVHPKLQLGALVSGSYMIQYMLRSVLFEERADTRIKAVVGDFVENLLRFHDGLFVVQTAISGDKTGHAIASSAPPPLSFMEMLFRSAKVLRNRDSMHCSRQALTCLRLMYLTLSQLDVNSANDSTTGGLLSTHVSSAERAQQWRWLLALVHDRCSEVKLLALQTISLLQVKFPLVNGYNHDRSGGWSETKDQSAALQDDWLNPIAEGDNDDNGDDADEGEESRVAALEVAMPAAVRAEDEQWPPRDVLQRLASDKNECRVVRAAAIGILVSDVTSASAAASAILVNYKLLLAAMGDCLSLSEVQACVSSVDAVVDSLLRLVAHSLHRRDFAADILPLMRATKLLPLLVELLQGGALAQLMSRAHERVSAVDGDGHAASDSRLNHCSDLLVTAAEQRDDDAVLRGIQGGDDSDTHNKYATVLSSHCAAAQRALRVVQGHVCRILHLLRDFEQRRVASPIATAVNVFEDCVKHSSLARYLVLNLGGETTSQLHQSSGAALSGAFELQSYFAHAELVAEMIAAECSDSPASGTSPPSVLHRIITERDDAVQNILQQMVRFLFAAVTRSPTLFLASPSSDQSVSTARCFDGIFRLLAVMLCDARWRAMMCLGGPFAGCEASELVEYLFVATVKFRYVMATASSMAPQTNIYSKVMIKADVTLSLFMQHSFPLRALLVKSDNGDGSSSDDVDSNLFHRSLAVVAEAAAFLANPPLVTASASPATDKDRALRTLKDKYNGSGSGSVTSTAASARPNRYSSSSSAAAAAAAADDKDTQSVNSTAASSKASTIDIANRRRPQTAASTASVASVNGSKAVRASASTLGSRSASASAGVGQWRCKSRGFTSNAAPSKVPATDFPDHLKARLHSALMVLAAALPGCDEAITVATKANLHYSLSRLLRYAAFHTQAARFTSGIATTLQQFSAKGGASSHQQQQQLWKPSCGQLSAAIYALCCAFTYDCSATKQLMANAGENHAAVISPTTTTEGGNTLHHLVSQGVSTGVHAPVRWLCLSLTSALVGSVRQIGNSPSLRSVLTARVAKALQRSAHSHLADTPDVVGHLVHCLSAFVSSAQVDRSSASGPSAFYNTAVSGSDARDTAASPEGKLVAFPELMAWVGETYGDRTEVVYALCRCLGVVNSAGRSSGGGGTNLAALMTEPLIRLLWDCMTSHDSQVVRNAALVSLWSIVHGSEKAKMITKEVRDRSLLLHGHGSIDDEVLALSPSKSGYGESGRDENDVYRAGAMLRSLLM